MVLSHELDPELQAISAEAGKSLAVPMAAVVLAHEEVTFLRGYFGFPESARINPRDASFCQFVVRDGGAFEVNDAAKDDRVPQEPVENLGVASYLGVPIVLYGKTVGSMCVLDTEPRLFDDREHFILRKLAARASQRLALLATQPRELERTLHDRAVRPAFGEIRNRMMPVLGNVAAMQGMVDELLGHRKAVDMMTDPVAVAKVRAKADAVLAELAVCLEEMTTDTSILHRSILAVEGASLMSDVMCSIHDVIGQAQTLADHRTKLVAGVTWQGECRDPLCIPRTVAVNALAAALAGLAESMPSHAMRGIRGTISSRDAMAMIELRAEVPPAAVFALATHLAVLFADGSSVGIRDNALQLGFATTPLS
jgi:hypothetical protein